MSTETKPSEKKPPVHKIRDGLITASIWERSGDTGSFYSVTFDRRYSDRNGNWKSTDVYDSGYLLSLAKVADLAHTWILNTLSGKDPG